MTTPPIMTEVTPEVIAWARDLIAQVDGPPPLAIGERVIYTPGYGHVSQPAVVRSLYHDGRVQIRTQLAGFRNGETVSDNYCRTVRADQLTRPGAITT